MKAVEQARRKTDYFVPEIFDTPRRNNRDRTVILWAFHTSVFVHHVSRGRSWDCGSQNRRNKIVTKKSVQSVGGDNSEKNSSTLCTEVEIRPSDFQSDALTLGK